MCGTPPPADVPRVVGRGRFSGVGRCLADADGDDEDEENLVAELVDDAVVAGADPPLPVPTDQLIGATRARLVSKQLDGDVLTRYRPTENATSR